jgi:hypothetical protein
LGNWASATEVDKKAKTVTTSPIQLNFFIRVSPPLS